MKFFIMLTLLLPVSGMASTLNNNHQPGKPGYNPSTQRMQQQMQTQQSQQQLRLRQEQQRQHQDLQRQLQNQRDSNSQRVINSQPGRHGAARPPSEKNTLP